MKKIPTLFVRDFAGDPGRVLPQVHPDCAWVLAGEGVATRKLDGMCALVRDGKLYKRREIKPGQPEPEGFEAADHDEETGKTVGWVPVGDGPEDKFFREAWATLEGVLAEGHAPFTCELVGPKSQGGVEREYRTHVLVSHAEGTEVFPDAPRTFDRLREWLAGRDIEGVVFHRPDGRMAKLKLRDFGLKRGRAA